MNTVQLNINLNFQQLVDAVKKLSPAEKLKLNDAIWDGNMQVPDEHKKIVAERMAKSKHNPGRMLDWDKASKTLKP
jgi:Putative addiction module component